MALTRLLQSKLLPAVLTLCLLAGLALERHSLRGDMQDPVPYHQQVRAAVEAIPFRIGSWFGTDSPVPPAAVALLHANVALCRSYKNIDNGRQITFLLVHCSDARDILGH